MMPASTVDADRAEKPFTATQRRIVDAALRLFGDHGISGTSLQMIADEVGVTKAAIYHQFRTKDDIIVAAMEEPVRRLEAAVDAADAEDRPAQAVEVLLAQVVDLAVENRALVRNLQGDPIMARFLSTYQPFQAVMGRLYGLLAGNRPNTPARVRAAMVSAALASTAVHPLVADLDDETLRAHMTNLAREFLAVPTTLRTEADGRTKRKLGPTR
jgi:AcrR family transcriptional regulator